MHMVMVTDRNKYTNIQSQKDVTMHAHVNLEMDEAAICKILPPQPTFKFESARPNSAAYHLTGCRVISIVGVPCAGRLGISVNILSVISKGKRLNLSNQALRICKPPRRGAQRPHPHNDPANHGFCVGP